MVEKPIDCVVISTDAAFVSRVSRLIAGPEKRLRLSREYTRPLPQLSKLDAEELRESSAQLVVLDVGDDPSVGLRLARFLAGDKPGRALVLTGPQVEPDVLLEAMRLGASEYLPKPVDDADLSAALSRASRRLGGAEHREAATPQGRIIAVYAAKGGAGATTTAANLAVELCQEGRNATVLVDFDLEHGASAVLLGLRPRYSILDVVQNLHRLDRDLLTSFVDRHESGVTVLASPALMGPGENMSRDQARAVLQFLRRQFEYVVVDTEKSYTGVMGAAVENADEVLMVTTPDLVSLRNTKKALPLVERSVADPQNVHIVVNRLRATDIINSSDVAKALGREVYSTLSADEDVVADSMSTGSPAVLKRKSRYSRDIQAMAALLVRAASTNGKPSRDKKLFGGRFGRTVSPKS